MTDLGVMTYFLIMEIHQSQDGIFICQRRYVNEMLKKFGMDECKSVATPLVQNQRLCKDDGAASVDETDYRRMIGILLYLTATRPDLSSKKQEVVTQSTAEAECILAAATVNEAIWLRNLLADMENPVMHGRTKHIKIKFHAVREAEQSGEIRLTHCKGEMQLVDIFTKSLCKSKFEDMKLKFGVSSKNIKEECSKE
ncbi:uncharacterized protein LOC116125883 [Pistacia vera]|uniref:uncharacterized protein LOC116125883 n=1 Tax=Pistacia vera TaxID=55513 RepID=UPI001262E402|nr:uncharacterized protein LOC116125883 [Pistacia vera]